MKKKKKRWCYSIENKQTIGTYPHTHTYTMLNGFRDTCSIWVALYTYVMLWGFSVERFLVSSTDFFLSSTITLTLFSTVHHLPYSSMSQLDENIALTNDCLNQHSFPTSSPNKCHHYSIHGSHIKKTTKQQQHTCQ